MPAHALAAALFGGLGVPVGMLFRGQLRAGAWRRPDEVAPLPGFGWLLVVTPIVFALVGWKAAQLSWWTAPAYLLLAGVGVLLAAVDADVHRLPDRLTLWPLPASAGLLAAASAGTGDWHRLPVAVAAGLGIGLFFLLLALAVPSGLGLGDVKLALHLGFVLGWLGIGVVVAWIFYGFVAGGLWAAALIVTRRATHTSHLAFGPPLLLGGLLALLGAASL